jgi:uncharacterized protein (TIGR03118 family)
MDYAPNGPFAVADNGFGLVTLYDATGKMLPQEVTIPAPPSQPPGPDHTVRGLVYNPTSEFVISEDGRSAPAEFLFCSKSGTISGWNPAVDPDHAIIMVNNSTEGLSGAWYSGLVIDKNSQGQNVLYVADRANNRIDRFDGNFHSLSSFTDPSVAADPSYLGTHPGAWQVEDVNGRLFVTWTLGVGPSGSTPRSAGGVVDVFDTDGNLLTPNHFASNVPGKGPLEDPWGIVQAPDNFGKFSNDILIGNVEGAGNINAFDPATGTYLGQLTHADGTPIAIAGLWDMSFGGGNHETGRTNWLYFDGGPTLEHPFGQGLFGRIIAAGKGDERGRSDDSPAGTAGSASPLQDHPGPAQIALLVVGGLLPSAGPQGVSLSSNVRFQPSNLDGNNSVSAPHGVLVSPSAREPMAQSGLGRTMTDVLDAMFGELANAQDDGLGKLP